MTPSKITYEFTEQVYEHIKDDAIQIAEKNIHSRFATKLLDVKAASQVLGVSEDTIRSYVGLGRLEPETRKALGKIRFRLSYLLNIDISKLKYKRT